MKKILILCLLVFLSVNTATAKDHISFIYINGSNTNDAKMTKWFLDGIFKTQKDMQKAFNSSPVVKEKMLKNGTRSINELAIPFYWGNMSQMEIRYLREELDVNKIFTPHLAQTVRRMMAYCLHDAIWVTKDYNMGPIVRNLHRTVMEEYNNDNSVILFGYSAGSFITAQYLVSKAKYINPKVLFENMEISNAEKEIARQQTTGNTCLDALVASELVVLSNEQELIPNKNPQFFETNYAKLNKLTKIECIPDDALTGIVNFASPLSLFYSNMTNENYKGNIFNKFLVKYLVENDMFFLTVNYAEDPLGFPNGDNRTFIEYRQYWKDLKQGGGFIYDKSDTKTMKTFINTHTSYWATSRKFSKTVVKAYEEGLQHFYSGVPVKSSKVNNNPTTTNTSVAEKDIKDSEYLFGTEIKSE